MRRFEVFSGYRQFYIADIELSPPAPEIWTEEHVSQRHNTQKHIAALCPVGDITSRVTCWGPGEVAGGEESAPDFEIKTHIEVPSGKIGVFGWPWELKDSYEVIPGSYSILFRGYQTERADDREDYYVVQIEAVAAST